MSQFESDIRVKLSQDDFSDIRGLRESAFANSDWMALNEEDIASMVIPGDNFKFESGSIRLGDVSDPDTGQRVNYWECVATVSDDSDETADTQRLLFHWEDGSSEEIDLDTGEILYDVNHEADKSDLSQKGIASKKRIFRVLMAAVEDAI